MQCVCLWYRAFDVTHNNRSTDRPTDRRTDGRLRGADLVCLHISVTVNLKVGRLGIFFFFQVGINQLIMNNVPFVRCLPKLCLVKGARNQKPTIESSCWCRRQAIEGAPWRWFVPIHTIPWTWRENIDINKGGFYPWFVPASAVHILKLERYRED